MYQDRVGIEDCGVIVLDYDCHGLPKLISRDWALALMPGICRDPEVRGLQQIPWIVDLLLGTALGCGFTVSVCSCNPSAIGERDLPGRRLVLYSPAGLVLLLRLDFMIAVRLRGDYRILVGMVRA